jgi:type IV secretory pathway VirB10-like protein
MRRLGTLATVCAFLLGIGGCHPRQQPGNLVVYVPAPAPAPAAVSASATAPQVLVIPEPAPPEEAEETPPPETPEPAKNPAVSRTGAGRRARAVTPAEPEETPTEESPETPPAEVPALEPRQSSAQQDELRRQYANMERDIRQRLDRLSGAHLAGNDQKTLADARTFFTQAEQAVAGGDLPRALNLARKASLLLAALE